MNYFKNFCLLSLSLVALCFNQSLFAVTCPSVSTFKQLITNPHQYRQFKKGWIVQSQPLPSKDGNVWTANLGFLKGPRGKLKQQIFSFLKTHTLHAASLKDDTFSFVCFYYYNDKESKYANLYSPHNGPFQHLHHHELSMPK